MFDANSRYASIEVATFTRSDGEEIAYVRRRFLPRGQSQPHLIDVTLADGERLDLIAARVLGEAESYWRICDANDGMNPFELEAEPGRELRINVPQAGI